jgi:hypothetical protein
MSFETRILLTRPKECPTLPSTVHGLVGLGDQAHGLVGFGGPGPWARGFWGTRHLSQGYERLRLSGWGVGRAPSRSGVRMT